MPWIFYHFRQNYWQLGSHAYRMVLQFYPQESGNDTLASVIGVGVDMWEMFHAWGGFLFSFHLNLAFMHTFKSAIQLILDNRLQQKETSRSSRLTEKVFIYRKLRILTTVFNNVFGMTYIPASKTMMGLMISGSVVVSVRLAPRSHMLVGLFGVSMGLIGIACMSMFIIFTAMVNEYSLKFKNHLNCGEFYGNQARRVLRAFRVEAVKSGGFYAIQRNTCLTVLGLIANMCGSILISVKID